MSCQEIELLPNQEVTDVMGGVKYLNSTIIMVPGVPYSSDVLVSMLFQVSMLPWIKGSWANMNVVWVASCSYWWTLSWRTS